MPKQDLYAIVRILPNELEEKDKEGYRVIPGSVFQNGAAQSVIMRLKEEELPIDKPQKEAKPQLTTTKPEGINVTIGDS